MGATIRILYGHKLCVFAKLVVVVSIISELSHFRLLNFAHDAFKELLETNFCKYTIEVVTLLNVPL